MKYHTTKPGPSNLSRVVVLNLLDMRRNGCTLKEIQAWLHSVGIDISVSSVHVIVCRVPSGKRRKA